ncbi:MAG: Crp/Fnr family transcriptional regulator [Sphingobacteriales bacterium]|nr:MAG: Crp/Fnr family transcriptional regulator [Sphingobacteriales bacterium]
MSAEKKLLVDFVLKRKLLPPKEMEAFLEGWEIVSFKRKEVITRAGDTEKYLYFVLEGVQRSFYVGTDKQEATLVFTYPPSFSGIVDSLLTQTASKCFLETLTASKFLRLPYHRLETLIKQYPLIQNFVLQLTAMALKGVLERQIEIQCFSAEEKFTALLKRSPHVLNLIPHKYLASYLGLDPTTFSKLLGSVKL